MNYPKASAQWKSLLVLEVDLPETGSPAPISYKIDAGDSLSNLESRFSEMLTAGFDAATGRRGVKSVSFTLDRIIDSEHALVKLAQTID